MSVLSDLNLFLSFIIFSVVTLGSPGAASISIIAHGATYGVRSSFPYLLGINTMFSTKTFVVAWVFVLFGQSLYFNGKSVLLLFLKILSTCVLLYLASKIAFSKISLDKSNKQEDNGPTLSSQKRGEGEGRSFPQDGLRVFDGLRASDGVRAPLGKFGQNTFQTSDTRKEENKLKVVEPKVVEEKNQAVSKNRLNFFDGILLNAVNPKSYILCVLMVGQFVGPNKYNPWQIFLLAFSIDFLVEFTWLNIGGRILRLFYTTKARATVVNSIMATMMVLVGAYYVWK